MGNGDRFFFFYFSLIVIGVWIMIGVIGRSVRRRSDSDDGGKVSTPFDSEFLSVSMPVQG